MTCSEIINSWEFQLACLIDWIFRFLLLNANLLSAITSRDRKLKILFNRLQMSINCKFLFYDQFIFYHYKWSKIISRFSFKMMMINKNQVSVAFEILHWSHLRMRFMRNPLVECGIFRDLQLSDFNHEINPFMEGTTAAQRLS